MIHTIMRVSIASGCSIPVGRETASPLASCSRESSRVQDQSPGGLAIRLVAPPVRLATEFETFGGCSTTTTYRVTLFEVNARSCNPAISPDVSLVD